MKTYRGTREASGVVVTVRDGEGDDRPLPHVILSMPPFDWGRSCSGAAELALAVLADLRGAAFAKRWYLIFASEVIRKLPGAAWTLSEAQINEALRQITAGAPGSGEDEEVWEPTEESQVIE